MTGRDDKPTVRIATPEDGAAFAAIYAPIVASTPISFETEPPTAEEMGRRIAATLEILPWLAAVQDGEILGYAYAGRHRERSAYRWSVDVTAYVAEASRRRGVGRLIYGKLIRILTAQGFRSAFAGITLPNAASVGLHEAMGFEPIGVYRQVGFKLGQWRDVGWWRRSLTDDPGPPREPEPFDAWRRRSGRA